MAVATRLRDEAGAQFAMTLWTATAIMTGLRCPREQAGEMIECEKPHVLVAGWGSVTRQTQGSGVSEMAWFKAR